MANEILPQNDGNSEEKMTWHCATCEERCKAMAKKYGWDYSHFKLTRDSILTHKCFYIGDAEFPKTYGDNDCD